MITFYNEYLTRCDILYQIKSKNSYSLAKVKKLNINFYCDEFISYCKKIYQSNKNNDANKSNFYFFIFIYLSILPKIFFNFKNKKENNFLLKIKLSYNFDKFFFNKFIWLYADLYTFLLSYNINTLSKSLFSKLVSTITFNEVIEINPYFKTILGISKTKDLSFLINLIIK